MPTIADAKRELEEFRSSLPSYKFKAIDIRHSEMTDEESAHSWADLAPELNALAQRYVKLLEQVPDEAKQYRERAMKNCGLLGLSLFPMPRVRGRGRPSMEALADEIAELKSSGKSYAEIADILNQKYSAEIESGEMEKRTPDNVRILLHSYYHRSNG